MNIINEDNKLGRKRIRHKHLKEVLNLIRLSGANTRVDIRNIINLLKASLVDITVKLYENVIRLLKNIEYESGMVWKLDIIT